MFKNTGVGVYERNGKHFDIFNLLIAHGKKKKRVGVCVCELLDKYVCMSVCIMSTQQVPNITVETRKTWWG